MSENLSGNAVRSLDLQTIKEELEHNRLHIRLRDLWGCVATCLLICQGKLQRPRHDELGIRNLAEWAVEQPNISQAEFTAAVATVEAVSPEERAEWINRALGGDSAADFELDYRLSHIKSRDGHYIKLSD